MKRFLWFLCLGLVVGLLLSGCSKNSKNPLGPDTTPTVKTEQARSSVVTDEIGGVSLMVNSAYKEEASVAENKTFSTEVSKEGTQLLFVTDETRQVRGLTISVVEEKGIKILDVDATSTAYSLLLLTPGITTTSPAETRERLLIFDSLNSFHALVAHLKEHLPNQSLPAVVENETTQQLLVRCIEEYVASISGTPVELFKKAVDFHDFYIYRKVDSKGEETVVLENYGWRRVHVRRKDFAGIGATSVVVVRDNMKGVEPHSWGTYIWWVAGNPTVLADETYPPGSDVTRLEYWIYGPGFKKNNLSMPLDVKLSINVSEPWVWTIYSYLIEPLFSLTGGLPLDKAIGLSEGVVSEILTSSKAINSLNQLLSLEDPQNWLDVAAPLTNTTLTIVGIAAGTAGASPGWMIAAAFLAGGTPVFSVVNLYEASCYFMDTPRVLKQELSQTGTVTDIDGNVYKTVTIGTQTWMAENLKTTKYNDGTAIPLVTDNTAWANLTTPGYCWYNNDEATYKNTYGALYNWYTVNSGKLCPTGWHIPSDAECTILINYLGGENVAGGKLKEAGTTHWQWPNTGATNESGFTALPGGCRSYRNGKFRENLGYEGFWWNGTALGASSSVWCLGRGSARVDYYGYDRRDGFSVRCIRD